MKKKILIITGVILLFVSVFIALRLYLIHQHNKEYLNEVNQIVRKYSDFTSATRIQKIYAHTTCTQGDSGIIGSYRNCFYQGSVTYKYTPSQRQQIVKQLNNWLEVKTSSAYKCYKYNDDGGQSLQKSTDNLERLLSDCGLFFTNDGILISPEFYIDSTFRVNVSLNDDQINLKIQSPYTSKCSALGAFCRE